MTLKKIRRPSLKKKYDVMDLYDAVKRYAEAHGGTVLVGGGVQIQQWPDDLNCNYTIAVRVTGRLPLPDHIENKT